jgi:hypothetical protein
MYSYKKSSFQSRKITYLALCRSVLTHRILRANCQGSQPYSGTEIKRFVYRIECRKVIFSLILYLFPLVCHPIFNTVKGIFETRMPYRTVWLFIHPPQIWNLFTDDHDNWMSRCATEGDLKYINSEFPYSFGTRRRMGKLVK